jgi:hypothetical protein
MVQRRNEFIMYFVGYGMCLQHIPHCFALCPAHFNTWNTFVAEFSTRFIDTQEQEMAAWRINTGKIRQTTSACLYIDQIQEECVRQGTQGKAIAAMSLLQD